MTTRTEIDDAVRIYGTLDREQLPAWLRDPRTEHEFNLASAVLIATDPRWRAVSPVYNDDDELVAWRGIRFKNKT